MAKKPAKKPAKVSKKPKLKLPKVVKKAKVVVPGGKKKKAAKKKKQVGPLAVRFQINTVLDARNEDGSIVRKTIEASGPHNAILIFESTVPEHHVLLEQDKWLEATFKEVTGPNA